MSEKLLPCPFCGGVPELDDYRTAPAGAWVMVHRAKGCVIAPRVDQFSTEEAAIAAWNRRTPAPEGEVVGTAGAMPGTSGFTTAVFRASAVPVGTPLYASPVFPVEVRQRVLDELDKAWVHGQRRTSWRRDESADAILAILRPTDTGRE